MLVESDEWRIGEAKYRLLFRSETLCPEMFGLNSTEIELLQGREGNSRINGGFQQVRGILRFQM